jgi:hypothetical protein
MASLKSIAASSLLFAALSTASVDQVLAPADDIVFASSSSAKDPLAWAGANSPYRAGTLSLGTAENRWENRILIFGK